MNAESRPILLGNKTHQWPPVWQCVLIDPHTLYKGTSLCSGGDEMYCLDILFCEFMAVFFIFFYCSSPNAWFLPSSALLKRSTLLWMWTGNHFTLQCLVIYVKSNLCSILALFESIHFRMKSSYSWFCDGIYIVILYQGHGLGRAWMYLTVAL